MKYVSIDIETTGLDPNACTIFQIGAVIDDLKTPVNELPSFKRGVQESTGTMVRSRNVWTQEAWDMHRDQWPTIVRQPSVPATHLATVFEFWLQENGLEPPYVVAGKNFASFDLRFLRRLPNWNLKLFHRFIDPSMFYMHVGDDVPPSTDECLKRAGIQKMVEHDALADAYDVVRLVRKGILGVVC